ncbi:MAG TPA: hypothetical protein PLT68_02275 [Actinomycetota bacterium]|nr:hypothetical protein [Actinomycetota bacterium]
MLRRYRPVLANRRYLLLLLSSVVSEAGDWAARLALTWLMYLLTDSVMAAAAVLVVSVLPAAAFGPWLTSATARWDHRTAAISCDLTRAGLFAVVAVHPSPLTALGAAAVAGMISVAFESHRSAWLPHVTGLDELGTAVSLSHALSDATVIIGYAVGGILLGLLGVSGVLWVNVVTFALSAAVLVAVGSARSVEDDDEAPTGIRAAVATLLADRVLLVLAALATLAVAAATGIEAIALPVLTRDAVPVSVTGIVLAAAAGLSLAATLALPGDWTHGRAARWVGLLIVAAFGGCGFGLLFGSPVLTSLAIIVTGLAYVALVPANVLLTVTFPAQLRASIFSVLGATLAVMQALSAVVAAAAVDRFGTTGLVGLCAVLTVLALILLTLRIRTPQGRTEQSA